MAGYTAGQAAQATWLLKATLVMAEVSSSAKTEV
jgi:hypothetical protein